MLLNLCELMSTLKFGTNKEISLLIYTNIFMIRSLLLEQLYFLSIIYSVSLTSLPISVPRGVVSVNENT